MANRARKNSKIVRSRKGEIYSYIIKKLQRLDAKMWLLICFLNVNLELQFLSEFGRPLHTEKKIGRFDSMIEFCRCLQNVPFAFVK